MPYIAVSGLQGDMANGMDGIMINPDFPLMVKLHLHGTRVRRKDIRGVSAPINLKPTYSVEYGKKRRTQMALRKTAILTIGLLLLCSAALAAAKPDLWEYWLQNDPSSKIRLDHSAWDQFLKSYLLTENGGINRVRYGQVSPADRAKLEGYIRKLEQTPVSRLHRFEQKPFWINLYNAVTVKIIIDHYPVKSIRDIDISPGLFSNGPWGKQLISVESQKISLDDIEHRILRPIWKDPRIHYGVNCASIGCPNLQPMAYTRDNMDDLLDKGAREYINHDRGARVEGGRLVVSSIYNWFEVDFGGNDAGVIAHLKKYARPGLQEKLESVDRIADTRYDWTLNDAASRP